MNWFASHTLHLILIAGYLAVLAHHAWLGRRHVHSVDDYLVAGRRLGGFVIALSFYATFMSTNTFLGAAGKSWEFGVSWCTGGVVLTALACLSWFVVAPRFVPLTRVYESLTVADFVGTHYQSPAVRRFAAALVAFSSVLYLIAIYRGAALALATFLDLPYPACVLAVFAVVTLYTLMGGFESVVLTDAVQGVLMLSGAVAIGVGLVVAGGGVSQIWSQLAGQDPALTDVLDPRGLSAAAAYSLAVGVKFLVEPRQLSRFYGLKDRSAYRAAAIVSPLVILLSYVCLLPAGAMAHAVLPPESIESTDEVIPRLLGTAQLLGPVVSTLFLLVLISAAMSSIDSVLLVAAATIDRDLLAQHKSRSMAGVQRTRIWVVVVSLAAAATALSPYTRDIVRMTKFSGSLYGACFLPVLVVGLFLRRRSAAAAVATMVLGAATVVSVFVLRELGYTQLQEVYPGIIVGLMTFAVLHALLPGRRDGC